MGKIDKILKKVLPPATREFRDGFDNKSIVDSLRESEKLALEKELIKLLPETNDLLIADTLAYLKSKEAIPILMEKMNTRLPDFEFPVSKILIATCIFEIDGSNKEMIQIVKDEFEKLEKSSYKGGMFYQLIKFRDESLNDLIRGYFDHKDYLLSYHSKLALKKQSENHSKEMVLDKKHSNKKKWWKFW